MENVLYNASLAITRCIKVASQEKLYKELDQESLKLRTELLCICTFYKFKSTGFITTYLTRLTPSIIKPYQTKTLGNVTTYQCRVEILISSFFPLPITEWNNLDTQIRISFYKAFKKTLVHSLDQLLILYLIFTIL